MSTLTEQECRECGINLVETDQELCDPCEWEAEDWKRQEELWEDDWAGAW